MLHVPTTPAVRSATVPPSPTVPLSRNATVERPIDVHMLTTAATLARRGIGTAGSRYLRYGANVVLARSRSSSAGELRASRYEALRTNTVVGRPGTKTPMTPSPAHVTPPTRNSHLRRFVER